MDAHDVAPEGGSSSQPRPPAEPNLVVEGFDVDALFPPVEPPRPFDPPPATFAHLRGAVAPLVRKWLDPATSNLRPLQQRGIKKILLYLDNVLKGVGEHDPGDPNGGADGMTLFVSKLPPDLSDDQFAELFASVNIQNVELAYAQVQRAVDGTSRGYGLVKFYIPSEESEDEENAARRGSGTKSTPEKKREAAEKRAIRKRAEDAVAAIGQREPIKVGDRTLDIKLASANQVERFEQGRISCTYRAFTAAGKTMVQGALAFMLPLVPQRSRPAYASSCPGRVWIWCPSVASWKNAYKSLFVDFPKVVEVLGLPPEWLLFALGTGPRDKRILDNDTLSSIMRTEDRFAAIRRCQILIATPNLMRNLLLDHEKCRTYLTEEEYDPRKKTLALFHAILVDEGDYGTKRTGIFTRMLVRHVDAIKIYFSGTVDRPAGDPLVNVTEHTKYGELLHYGVVKPMVITLLASAGTASDGRLTNYSKLRKKCLDAHSTPDELRVFVHEIVERWLHNRTEDNLPGQMLIFVPAAASGSKATAEEDARSKVLGKQILDMILGIVREKTDGKTCPILGRPLKAEMLSSSKDAKARADIEAQFGLLDIDILVVLDMYSRSADFPLINHVAHLRAYLDENGYPMIVQRGGRGVRGIQRQLYDHIRQHQLAKGLQMPEFDDVKRQVLHVFEIAHHLHLAHYQRMMVEEEVLPGQFVINPIWRVAPPPETKFTVFLTQAQANPDGTARIMAETEVPIKMELSFGMKMRWSEFVEDIADNFHGSSNNLFVYTVADDGQLWQMIDGPPDMLALDWITEQRCRRDNLGRWCLFSTIAQPAVEESGDDDQALRGRQLLRQEEERNRRNLSPNPDTDMIELPDPTLQQQQQETSQSMQDSAGNGRESGAGNGQSNDGSDNGVQPPVIRQPNGRSTVIQQDDTSGGSTDTRTQVPEPRPQSEHPPDPQIGPPSGSGADKIPKDGHRKSEEINGKQLKKTEGSGSVAGASNGKVSRTRDSTPLPPPRQDIYITGRIAIANNVSSGPICGLPITFSLPNGNTYARCNSNTEGTFSAKIAAPEPNTTLQVTCNSAMDSTTDLGSVDTDDLGSCQCELFSELTITGHVLQQAGKDGTKKPLKDVSVTVKDNGNTYVTGRSNSNGEIEFSRAETALFEKELQVIVGRQPTDSSVRTDRLGNFTINLVIEAPEALKFDVLAPITDHTMVYWTLEFSQDVEVCDDKGHPAIAFFTTQAPSPNLTLRAEYVECDGSTMTFSADVSDLDPNATFHFIELCNFSSIRAQDAVKETFLRRRKPNKNRGSKAGPVSLGRPQIQKLSDTTWQYHFQFDDFVVVPKPGSIVLRAVPTFGDQTLAAVHYDLQLKPLEPTNGYMKAMMFTLDCSAGTGIRMSDEPRDDILDATGTALRVPLVRIQFHFATAGAGFQGDHGRKVELPRDAANLGLNDFVDPQTGRFSTTRPPVVDELQGGEDVVVGRSRIVPNPDLFGKENTVSLIRPHDFAATSSKPTKPLEERKAHITQRMERLAQWKRMHGEDKLLELKHPDVLLYFVCKHAGKLPHGKALEVAEKHMESTNTLVQRLHSAAGESKGLAQEGMALFNTHFSETGFWMLNEDIRDFAVERFKEIVEKGAKRKANDVEGADGGLGTKRAKASDETNP